MSHGSISKCRRGVAMLAALALLAVIMLVAMGLVRQVVSQQRASLSHLERLQVHYLAESALDRAALKTQDEAYVGETWQPNWQQGAREQKARVQISVQRNRESNSAEITILAEYPASSKNTPQSRASLQRTISLPASQQQSTHE